MTKTVRCLLAVALLVLLSACTASAPVLIASLGISGAALNTYCVTSGSCSPSVLVYSETVIAEASADALIWESGSTVPEKVTQIISNLNITIRGGKSFENLTPEARAQVNAILATATALVPLFEALLSKPAPTSVISPAQVQSPFRVIHIPPLTPRDRQALDKMRATKRPK